MENCMPNLKLNQSLERDLGHSKFKEYICSAIVYCRIV